VVGERNNREIEWLKQKYISKIKTIEKAEDYPTKTSALCGWCEYLSLCADGQAAVEKKRVLKEEKATQNGEPARAGKISKVVSDKTPVEASPAVASIPNELAMKARHRKAPFVSQDQLSLF
jgi:hypothetical protein